MANSKVLAVKNVKFTDQSTGELIIGRSLFLHTPTLDPDWNGYSVDKLWFPETDSRYGFVGSLKPGDELMIEYNRKGKPEEMLVNG